MRSLRPLRLINRAPGLKLVITTLLASLKPIGNVVVICFSFFVIFGSLGVQVFGTRYLVFIDHHVYFITLRLHQLLKGSLYYCDGPNIRDVRNRTDCLTTDPMNKWVNHIYNFDDLGQAILTLFVFSSKDGWVDILYTGLDAVGVDQQVHLTKLLFFEKCILRCN